MPAFDPANPSQHPIRLTYSLPFPEEDKKKYPWLSQEDRYYSLEGELGHGGFAIAYLGFPCDRDGRRIDGAEDVVIKLPRTGPGFTSEETLSRLREIQDKSREEWAHVRNRLTKPKSCTQANPIFDMGHVDEAKTLWILPVTVQPYLKSALPLNDWLKTHRPSWKKEVVVHENVEAIKLKSLENWLEIVTLIAEGLVEIHKRRIVHGDIWPPNIYLSASEPLTPIFIDFGESFGVMPTGDPRLQPNHAYRAPERGAIGYVPTEQIGVYSFGKLMLSLAIGRNLVIPNKLDDQPLVGYRRRRHIRDLLFEFNEGLACQRPEVLDIIGQCTELDPVNRPTMLEVCDQLYELSEARARVCSSSELTTRLKELPDKIDFEIQDRAFMRFIDRQIVELERLIDSCKTDMVEVVSTRDGLLAALVSLFGELQKDDSWTTLTTPSVWQHNALGLDGRYATATVNAVRRGASVQRAYAVSVEELGVEWSARLADSLKKSADPICAALGEAFDAAIAGFNAEMGKTAIQQTAKFMADHQGQFRMVIQSLDSMIERWNIRDKIFRKRFLTIEETKGLYCGLVPVATLAESKKLRAKNPVSLMYASATNQWLLVMTDVRGRNESEPPESQNTLQGGIGNAPQLRRVRVYKSVMGYPKDRILTLERLMGEKSLNIGPPIGELARHIGMLDAI